MILDSQQTDSHDGSPVENKILVSEEQKSQALGTRLKNYPDHLDLSEYDEFMRNE